MTSITGNALATSQQMVDFLLKANPAPKISIPVADFCELFLSEGEIEDIRGDIAFCQAIKETGWFRYGGQVLPEQNNYAGIGATNNSDIGKGAWFATPKLGIRAQIQHLKAYANNEPLNTQLQDPRFHLVKPRGKAPNWEDLNGKWAVPGRGYGEAILSIHDNLLKTPKVDYKLQIAALGQQIINLQNENSILLHKLEQIASIL